MDSKGREFDRKAVHIAQQEKIAHQVSCKQEFPMQVHKRGCRYTSVDAGNMHPQLQQQCCPNFSTQQGEELGTKGDKRRAHTEAIR